MPNQRDGGADDPPTDVPRLEKLDSPTGSPPSASLSSLMELEKCVSNLSLAHEIVVNGDFCLRPRSPPTDSLEGRVTEVMHRAFWDSLGQQLGSEPPDYSHAVVLLQEVKTMLGSLLLPSHVRLRAQLDEVLDMELIRRQVSHGALDLERLAGYVVGTMASLCAPVRDPEVKALRDLKGPVELLREIFRVLGLMKTDMVNFTIQSLRPHLLQQAVQYERAKFQQILDKQPASLDQTSLWLEAAAEEEEEAAAAVAAAGSDCSRADSRAPVSAAAVLNRAYVRLLRWDPQDRKYPETALMDRARLDALGRRLHALVLEASVLLLSGGAALSPPGFVGNLRRSVAALLEGRHTREDDLKEALEGVAETVLQRLSSRGGRGGRGGGGAAPPPEGRDVLRGQICDLWRSDNPVRTLIGERAQTFLRASLQAGGAKGVPEPPASLGPVGGELAELAAAFGRIVHFNRSVFGPFYAPLLRRLLLPAGGGGGEGEGAEDSPRR